MRFYIQPQQEEPDRWSITDSHTERIIFSTSYLWYALRLTTDFNLNFPQQLPEPSAEFTAEFSMEAHAHALSEA